MTYGWLKSLHPFFSQLALLPNPQNHMFGAKCTLCPSLAFSYIGSVTAWHSSSGHQPNFSAWYKEWNYTLSQRASPIFGWAAMTLGISLSRPNNIRGGNTYSYVCMSVRPSTKSFPISMKFGMYIEVDE